MIRCPGCGGRNQRDALSCEWCRLPFVQVPQRGLSARWWGTLSGIVIGILLLLVGGLAFLNATRSVNRAVSPGSTPSPPPLPPLQVASPSPPAAGSPAATAVRGELTPTPPPATASPLPTPTPTPRFARIANTGGLGANLRREPATSAPPVTVLTENAVVRLLGPEQQGADGRLWRQVDDGRGNQGWVPADLLVDAPAPAGR
jgi:Bacterial SH3 domain